MSAADYVYALSGLLQESPESTSLVGLPSSVTGAQVSGAIARHLNWKDAWQNAFQALSRKYAARTHAPSSAPPRPRLPSPPPDSTHSQRHVAARPRP